MFSPSGHFKAFLTMSIHFEPFSAISIHFSFWTIPAISSHLQTFLPIPSYLKPFLAINSNYFFLLNFQQFLSISAFESSSHLQPLLAISNHFQPFNLFIIISRRFQFFPVLSSHLWIVQPSTEISSHSIHF